MSSALYKGPVDFSPEVMIVCGNFAPKEVILRRFVFALIAAAMMPNIAAAAVTPIPFAATYTVSFRGINAGELHSTLRPEAPGEFVYETRATPRRLARLFVSSKAVERSVMRIDDNGVRPLSWFSNDGRSDNDALEFAWSEEKVSGTVSGERVDLPTEPRLQDRLSMQIAVITALLRGEELGSISMIDARVKQYNYTRAGTERIKTSAGEFETVLYESTRPGSSRTSRFWHSPELGFLPVRAEQLRNGKVETVMELVGVKPI
jgi:hypothetical protein